MLSILKSTIRDFPITYDLIEKILKIYLDNVKSKFVFNLTFFHPIADLITENNEDYSRSYRFFIIISFKIPIYMKYFSFIQHGGFSNELGIKNDFNSNKISIKELIN